MAQNYTKMWDAFLGGEWATGTALQEDATSQQYLDQTKAFYSNILDPAFDLPGFGETDLAGAYAAFSNVDFETAERDFRMAIGDPYGGGVGDPFSWEKVSRYNTGDPAGVGRLQDLLEDQLYGQGKFLGGETGADYGTATAKELETYTTGMTGEKEELTYGALTSGASLASGTSGATLRSGESTEVAEDVLIEAYKKAKTLGSDYRAGSELIEGDLEEDLNEALTTYLNAVDDEKERWFSSVMGNVNTFKKLEMEADLEEGETIDYQTMTDEQLEAEMDLTGGDFYNQWSCGYGQTWDATLNDGEGGCKDTTGEGGYEEKVESYKFSSDPACGIGELRNETTGVCEVRDDLGLQADDYGYLCDENDQGLKECGECGKTMTTCDDGSQVCDPGTCLETDDCGVYGGDGPQHSCWDGSMVCDEAECSTDPATIPDECGVPGGDGPSELCWDQSLVCDLSECSEDPATIVDECGVTGGSGPQHQCWDGSMACDDSECPRDECEDDEEWNSVTGQCEWTGTSGAQWGSSHCGRPENSCPSGKECNRLTGICYTPRDRRGGKGYKGRKKKSGTTGKRGELIGGR